MAVNIAYCVLQVRRRIINHVQYGYARISTIDQSPALQLDALTKAGCEKIYKDEGITGSTTNHPGLKRCLITLSGGTTGSGIAFNYAERYADHLGTIEETLRSGTYHV